MDKYFIMASVPHKKAGTQLCWLTTSLLVICMFFVTSTVFAATEREDEADPAGTYMEVENYTSYTDDNNPAGLEDLSALQTAHAGYQGSGYISNVSNNTGSTLPNTDRLNYDFNIASGDTGTYYFLVRGSDDGTTSNSCFLAATPNGGSLTYLGGFTPAATNWYWTNGLQTAAVDVDNINIANAGTSTLHLYPREGNGTAFQNDALYITQTSYTSTGGNDVLGWTDNGGDDWTGGIPTGNWQPGGTAKIINPGCNSPGTITITDGQALSGGSIDLSSITSTLGLTNITYEVPEEGYGPSTTATVNTSGWTNGIKTLIVRGWDGTVCNEHLVASTTFDWSPCTPGSVSIQTGQTLAGNPIDLTSIVNLTDMNTGTLTYTVDLGGPGPFTTQTDDFAGSTHETKITAFPAFTNWVPVAGSDGKDAWCYGTQATDSTGTGDVVGNPVPFAFIESSAAGTSTCGDAVANGSSQYLESNVLDASSYIFSFSFDYVTSLNGGNDAELHVDGWDGTAWVLDVAGAIAANDIASWRSVGPVDLSSFTNSDFKLRIRFVLATNNQSYENDLQLDNLVISGTERPNVFNYNYTQAQSVDTSGWTAGSVDLTVSGDDVCGDPQSDGPTSFTWNSCTDSTPDNLAISVPNANNATVSGNVTITATADEAMSNMTVSVSGTSGGTCDVATTAMSGSGPYTYSWNTSSCGTPAENPITITVNGDEPQCNIAKQAQWTDITIDNSCSPVVSITEPFSPTEGIAGTTSVTINGSGFMATRGAGKVSFNGTDATAYTSWSDTQIVVTVPAGATTGKVTVTNDNGCSATSSGDFGICTRNAPSLVPVSGDVKAGQVKNYSLTLFNNDQYCGTTDFSYARGTETLNPVANTSFTLPSSFTGGSTGALASGSSISIGTLAVTSTGGATVGDQLLTGIDITGSVGAHTATETVTTTIIPEWSDQELLHNSNRFGECSNGTYTGTSQSECEGVGGGTWTPTSKGGGVWGLPDDDGVQAGEKGYGPIYCSTCHEANSGNIKRVKKSIAASGTTQFPGEAGGLQVNFQAVSGANSFGDDDRDGGAGMPTTSTMVCEYCHTETDYHRYDMTGLTESNHAGANLTDCISCHPHNKGFIGAGGCTICHDSSSGVAAAPKVVDISGGTMNGAAYGNHLRVSSYTEDLSAVANWDDQCKSCHGFHTGDSGLIPNNPAVGINYTQHGGIYIGGTATSSTNEAEICWECHDAIDTDAGTGGVQPISEWGVNSDTNGAEGDYDFGSLDQSNWVGAQWTSAVGIFSYKTGTIQSTHSTSGSATAPGVDAVGDIRCTYCHDVHGTADYTGVIAAVDDPDDKPYLRGNWMGNPYLEDGAPHSSVTYPDLSPYGRVPRGESANDELGGFQIDQNNGDPTSGWTLSGSAGLCMLCHDQDINGDAVTVNTMNYFGTTTPSDGNTLPSADWVGTNGHSAAVIGGTNTVAANIFTNSDRGSQDRAGLDPDVTNGPMAYQGGSGGFGPGDTDDTPDTRGTRMGSAGSDVGSPGLQPYVFNHSNEFNRRNGYDWGATVDNATTQGNYHNFSCSKCHNPHASRLPRLMITNCLDTSHNSWDDDNGDPSNISGSNAGNQLSDATTAQNCHRKATQGGSGSGWNNVTPW